MTPFRWAWSDRRSPHGLWVAAPASAAMALVLACSTNTPSVDPDSGGPRSTPDATVPADSGRADPDSSTRKPDASPEPTGECGECGAGKWVDGTCTYPPDLNPVDPVLGLPPADVGDRQIFRPEDYPQYSDRPSYQITRAGADAAKVGGAVVLSRMYEVFGTAYLYPGVLYTGGGLRRACQTATVTMAAAATDNCVTVDDASPFHGGGLKVFSGPGYDQLAGVVGDYTITGNTLCTTEPLGFDIEAGWQIAHSYMLAHAAGGTYADDIVIDSIYFDGGWKNPDGSACNDATHDWREANTLPFRGRGNVIRNSVFTNTPSENLTICGTTLTGNIAYDLGGSFVHKSCSASEREIDVLENNYVENANIVGDALMQHSEGLITFSANSDPMAFHDNVFRNGAEGVMGSANGDDGNLAAFGGCYAHFPRLFTWYSTESVTSFKFLDVEMIDVGPIEKK